MRGAETISTEADVVAAVDDGPAQVRVEPRERARRRLDLPPVDDEARRPVEEDEDLLLVAVALVVLGDPLARRDLDEVHAERGQPERAPREQPVAGALEVLAAADRDAVQIHGREPTSPAAGLEQQEPGAREVREDVGADLHARVRADLAAQALGELLDLLVVERADQQLAAAQLDRAVLGLQPSGERLELGVVLGLDEHEVLRALLVGARVLDDLAVLGVEPRVALLVPDGDADVGGQPVGLDELAQHALGFARRRLGGRVDVQARTVARHDHAAAEPLARLVVEVVGTQALAERVAVALVVEVDLDAPLVRGKLRHPAHLDAS